MPEARFPTAHSPDLVDGSPRSCESAWSRLPPSNFAGLSYPVVSSSTPLVSFEAPSIPRCLPSCADDSDVHSPPSQPLVSPPARALLLSSQYCLYCLTLPVMSLERAYYESELKCVIWITVLLMLVIDSEFSHWQASHTSPAFGGSPVAKLSTGL